MIQLSKFVYSVVTGEIVTITVTPIKVAPEMIRVTTEGQSLSNHGGTTPEFFFGVNKPVNSSQSAEVLCNFPSLPADPDEEGEARIEVRGSKGGNFTGPTIKESNSGHVETLTFLVDPPAAPGPSLARSFAIRGGAASSKAGAAKKSKQGQSKKRPGK